MTSVAPILILLSSRGFCKCNLALHLKAMRLLRKQSTVYNIPDDLFTLPFGVTDTTPGKSNFAWYACSAYTLTFKKAIMCIDVIKKAILLYEHDDHDFTVKFDFWLHILFQIPLIWLATFVSKKI